MRLINSDSAIALLPEMEMTAQPLTQAGVLRSRYKKINLKNGLKSDQGPFIFELTAGTRDFLNLKRSWIFFNCHLLDPKGQRVPYAVKVPKIVDGKPSDTEKEDSPWRAAAPVEGIAGSLIRSVELRINGVLVEQSNLAAYRIYMENMLNFSDQSKEGNLSISGYTGGQEIFDNEFSPAHLQRTKMFQGGKNLQVGCRLPLNICSANKLFPTSQFNITLTVYLNSDKFVLEQFAFEEKNYKLKIEDMYCMVDEWEVSDGYSTAIEKELLTNGLIYNHTNVETRSFYIEKDRSHADIMSVYQGNLPKRVSFALVSQSAFDGNSKKSPFNFAHFDLENYSINAGGIQYPGRPLDLNFEENKFSEAYLQTLEAIGYARQNMTNSITLEKFKSGYAIFSCELTPTAHFSDMVDLLEESQTLSIHLKFRKPLPEGVYLVTLIEYSGVLYIGKDRHPRVNSV